MLRPVSVLSALLFLAGCASAPEPYQGIDYSAVPATRMNVAAVLVDSAFQPADAAPNIEKQLSPQPQETLTAALQQHYVPTKPNTAGMAQLRFVIKDASVTVEDLPKPEGWFAQQTNDKPEYRYTGHLVVETTTERMSRHAGFVSAEANRTLEVGGLSEAARERQVQGMVQQMVDDLIAQLDSQINANMGGYVVSGEDATITAQPSGRWDKVMNWK